MPSQFTKLIFSNILAVQSNEALVGVDGCMLLDDVESKAEGSHSTSINVTPSTAEMKYFQRTKEYDFESLFVEDNSNDINEYDAAPIPVKKKVERVERPNRVDSQKEARNTALSALKERRVQKKSRKPRCAPVDELYLTEERFCSREDSECKEMKLPWSNTHIR